MQLRTTTSEVQVKQAYCTFPSPFSPFGNGERKACTSPRSSTNSENLKAHLLLFLTYTNRRGSSAWESARLDATASEGEAEDRVVAGSNPALGTFKVILSLF